MPHSDQTLDELLDKIMSPENVGIAAGFLGGGIRNVGRGIAGLFRSSRPNQQKLLTDQRPRLPPLLTDQRARPPGGVLLGDELGGVPGAANENDEEMGRLIDDFDQELEGLDADELKKRVIDALRESAQLGLPPPEGIVAAVEGQDFVILKKAKDSFIAMGVDNEEIAGPFTTREEALEWGNQFIQPSELTLEDAITEAPNESLRFKLSIQKQKAQALRSTFLK